MTRKPPNSPLHQELVESRIADLRARTPAGGLREALIRGLLYAGMSRAAIDERGRSILRDTLREVISDHRRFSKADWAMPKEQVMRVSPPSMSVRMRSASM